MRVLMLGAGAIGGYFGGRMAEGGADITFLVRPRRAEQIKRNGLVIENPDGTKDAIPVKTVLAEALKPGWDAIVLSCKAYDLEGAIELLRPAAAGALIEPLLNGLRHLPRLDAAFGAENVAGGFARVSAVLAPDGTVRHLAPLAGWIHGARFPSQQTRVEALQEEVAKGGFAPLLSQDILGEMWEKYIFLCTLGTMCCLMRAPLAPIARSEHGARLTLEVLEDCVAAAIADGHPPRAQVLEWARRELTSPDAVGAASLMRDMVRGGKVEAEQIVGDMLARVRALGRPAPLLTAAETLLSIYQSGGTAT